MGKLVGHKKYSMLVLHFRSSKDFNRCMRVVGPLITDLSIFGLGWREISVLKEEFILIKNKLDNEGIRYTFSEENL